MNSPSGGNKDCSTLFSKKVFFSLNSLFKAINVFVTEYYLLTYLTVYTHVTLRAYFKSLT